MENNIATENKKAFTSVDKSLLLNAGRTIGRTFWLKKDKYTQEINKIEKDFAAAQDEELQKMIEEFRKKSEAKLEKKLAALKGKVAAIDAEQALWEKIIIEKTGYRAEEIFDFEITTSETGKKSVKASFKYPEVIPPVEIEHDGTHYAMSADGDIIEPECPTHEFGSDFDEDREADVDEDMPGEFTELPMPEEPAVTDEDDTPWEDEAVAAQTSPVDEQEPEYDSAGFSTEDGLQEGEPAELAEKVNNPEPTPEEREAMEQSWEEEKAQADQMIEAFAEGIDDAVNATANAADAEEEDPFFLG